MNSTIQHYIIFFPQARYCLTIRAGTASFLRGHHRYDGGQSKFCLSGFVESPAGDWRIIAMSAEQKCACSALLKTPSGTVPILRGSPEQNGTVPFSPMWGFQQSPFSKFWEGRTRKVLVDSELPGCCSRCRPANPSSGDGESLAEALERSKAQMANSHSLAPKLRDGSIANFLSGRTGKGLHKREQIVNHRIVRSGTQRAAAAIDGGGAQNLVDGRRF